MRVNSEIKVQLSRTFLATTLASNDAVDADTTKQNLKKWHGMYPKSSFSGLKRRMVFCSYIHPYEQLITGHAIQKQR